MILLLVWACAPGEPVIEPCEACGGECSEDTLPETTRNHVAGPIDYSDPPPTNGDHDACWAAWGEHTDEVPDENWVHNLEHGGVVFLYQCPGGCEDEVAEVAAYGATLPPGRWVLTPYSHMESRWAAVAWNHRLLLGCFDLDALSAFYTANVGHGPEDTMSDPSSSCM